MRIVSLLPSTTEIAFALGLGDQLVGVTHGCDYPPEARALPRVTRSARDDAGAGSAEVNGMVRSQLRERVSAYHLDATLLARLQPDLILTQAPGDPGAISLSAIQHAVRDLGSSPRILSIEPTSLSTIFETIVAVGAAADRQRAAEDLVRALRERVAQVRAQAAVASYRPRVACLKWLDPPFGPGRWLPEIVEIAGGQAGLGVAGQPSQRISWGDVIAFAPEVIILAPCGFDLQRTIGEAAAILPTRHGWEALPAVRYGRVYAVDASAYLGRPGPRIVDSIELLATLIHPGLFASREPDGGARRLF